MDDDAVLAAKADALADAIEAAVGPWVLRCVQAVAEAQGLGEDPGRAAAAAQAAAAAREEVVPAVRALLATDVDAQTTNPLTLLRAAVRHPTAVLRAAGATPVDRDDFERRAFPDDDYGLVPAAFADVDPALAEPGLEWGAAKAFVHRARRR